MSKFDNYDFKETEKKWQDYWKQNKTYQFTPSDIREDNFSIDTPPPTVSGQLHMGHIFSYTQTDFIARFKRMSGKNVFYPIGFDDNGLPTERLVEKKFKVKAVSTPSDEFKNLCTQVINEEEEKFEKLFTSVGFSFDWNYKYQTVSDKSRRISQLSFLELYNNNNVYRAEQPILWDTTDQTALAQADLEDKQKESAMHDIIFKCEDKDNITIATTRPELLAACVAVFYHPDDERYKKLNNKFAITPLFNIRVPILPDEDVLMEKGTGLVMCCTFGDTVDINWWKKHHLPLRIIIDKRGRIQEFTFKDCTNENEANNNYSQIIGLKILEARTKTLELLQEKNLLLKSTAITHNVKCAERSGTAIEIITTPQWFIKTIDSKNQMLERSEELNWFPQNMQIKLDSWINSVNWDWCISRQRFFGVEFPVWYSKRKGEEGKILIGDKNNFPIRPSFDLPYGYSRDEVEAETDVMDTWATSSLSPQLMTEYINKDNFVNPLLHKQIFPFDLRPQAHEILRTWAFYTMLKSHLHENSLPWKNIMVSGWCLAEDKTKMSKSKGNIISPENLLAQYGADAVRYWASYAKLGADTALSEEIIKNAKRLTNKIWNSAKFASTHFDKVETLNFNIENMLNEKIISCVDIWLITKIKRLVKEVTEYFNAYEYSLAQNKIDNFFWKDFCDNYLEICKTRAYNENGNDNIGQKSAIYTMYFALECILKLFAPFMPYITEEIYQKLYNKKSIHSQNQWPDLSYLNLNESYIDKGNKLIDILDLVRKAKAEKNISIKTPVKELVIIELYKEYLSDSMISDLKNVTNSENISFSKLVSAEQIIRENDNSLIIGLNY